MIFPDFRISALEKEMNEKKEVFERNKEEFRKNLHPVTLIREHKKTMLAALLSVVALGNVFNKINKKFGPKLKGNMVFSILNGKWFWRLLDFSFHIYKLTSPRDSHKSK